MQRFKDCSRVGTALLVQGSTGDYTAGPAFMDIPYLLPILWFHVPSILIVYGTSDGPQNDIDNYLGPCSNMLHACWGLTVCLMGVLSFARAISIPCSKIKLRRTPPPR